jgi:catechol 2,3-dioxygenase
MDTTYSIPTNTWIGHVHMKAADPDQGLAFTHDLLCVSVTMMYGSQIAFISHGGYLYHIW